MKLTLEFGVSPNTITETNSAFFVCVVRATHRSITQHGSRLATKLRCNSTMSPAAPGLSCHPPLLGSCHNTTLSHCLSLDLGAQPS